MSKAENSFNASIANYLIDSCATAYYFNLADGSVQVLQDSGIDLPELRDKVQVLGVGVLYYVDNYVCQSDRALVIEKLSASYIRDNLKKSPSYSFTFREDYLGRELIYRGIVLRGEDDDHAVILFLNITEEFQKELELAEVENERLSLIENNDRVMALEDNFECLYDVELDSGNYEVYIKKNTRFHIAQKSFTMRPDFYADIRMNISKLAFPEDMDTLLHVTSKEQIRSALEKDNRFEWYFRLIIENTPVWFKLRVVYKNSDRNNVIIGVFDAEQEVLETQAREKLRDELINRMIGDDGLFIIDCKKDTRRTIHDHCYGANKYSDSEKYSTAIHRYVDTFVSELDREKMREATDPAKMLERLKNVKEYSVEYRDLSSGVQRFYEMRVAKYSETEVLQSFREKDREILDNLIFKKLEADFFSIYAVDLDTDLIQVLKKSPFRDEKTGDTGSYTQTMLRLSELYEDETQLNFKILADISYLKKRFGTEDKATFTYKSRMSKDQKWVNVTQLVLSRHEDGTPWLFAIAFSFLDEDASKYREAQKQLLEDMQMIGGLASGYHALYYLNIDEKVFKVYSIDGRRVRELQKYVSEDRDPREMIETFSKSDLVHPDDRHVLNELTVDFVRERLAHSKKMTLRFRRNVDGAFLWTELDIVKYEPINERANVIALGFAVRDNEIRKELEQQKQLEDARNAAEAASRSKTSFLFNMSHDIRTPMNAITGFTAMAKKYSHDEQKVTEYLDKIDVAEKQLLALINQVLEMARIESGKLSFEEKPVYIPDKFNSMITVLAGQAKASGLDFHYSLENLTHPYVFADEAKMGSITLNIVSNSMKYTPEGGRIDFCFSEVVSKKKGYAAYKMTVSDTGIGMSRSYLKNLYEPFSREKSSTVSRIQGTGLGLSIVKSFVDSLGGKIEVHSQPGKGTCFEITIDLRIDTDESAGREFLSEPESGIVSFEGKRILLVEDNEMNREIARNILEESKFVVEDASDGDVAVEMMQNAIDNGNPNYYDCILMDIQMPRMNGYEATEAIRAMIPPTARHVPIIAMTANAFEEDRRDALACGMDEHLAKPIDVRKCFEVLARFIK